MMKFILLSMFICAASSFLVQTNKRYLYHTTRISASKDATDNESQSKPEPKRSINFSNLIQLIAMGAGAPGLGEFDRMDPETGKMYFKLEANNFVDSKGESLQTKAKYFNEGYVENRDEIRPPGFWANLLSGGKLQQEWEEQIKPQK